MGPFVSIGIQNRDKIPFKLVQKSGGVCVSTISNELKDYIG